MKRRSTDPSQQGTTPAQKPYGPEAVSRPTGPQVLADLFPFSLFRRGAVRREMRRGAVEGGGLDADFDGNLEPPAEKPKFALYPYEAFRSEEPSASEVRRDRESAGLLLRVSRKYR